MVRIHPDPPLLERSRRTKGYVKRILSYGAVLSKENGFDKFFKNSEGNEKRSAAFETQVRSSRLHERQLKRVAIAFI